MAGVDTTRSWVRVAAVLLLLAVVCGAFGAHGLKGSLSEYHLEVFEKAVFYHFVHALGLLVVSLLAPLNLLSEKKTKLICSLLLFGVVVFSGSLYLLAITDIRWLGAITPIGGTSFILAWLFLALSFNAKK